MHGDRNCDDRFIVCDMGTGELIGQEAIRDLLADGIICFDGRGIECVVIMPYSQLERQAILVRFIPGSNPGRAVCDSIVFSSHVWR